MSSSFGLSHISLKFLALNGEASPRPHFIGQKLRPRLTQTATHDLLHQTSLFQPKPGGLCPDSGACTFRNMLPSCNQRGGSGRSAAHHSALGLRCKHNRVMRVAELCAPWSLSALLGAGSLFRMNGQSWDPGKPVIGLGGFKKSFWVQQLSEA